jgi:UDP:flavonoid glycosyltransferase YjiC (YdhE family)
MARFLMAVWPIPGHYYPNLTLAVTLRERGHEVAFLSGRRAQKAIEEQGFPCLTFRHIDEEGLERIFFRSQPGRPWWRPRIAVQRARSHAWLVGLLPGQVADAEAAMEAWPPDALVCDPTLWGIFLVVPERSRVPVALFAYIPFCPVPGRDVPPLGLGLPAPRGATGRLRQGLARLLFRYSTRAFRAAANEVRSRHGLPPIEVTASEYGLRLPLYLVAGIRELDFERDDLPPSVHYVGPCPWERPRNGPSPDWLETRPRDQPWVYVSEGTIHTGTPTLARAAARGLAALPVQVVISTSAPGDSESLGIGPTAPNTQLEHWVNIHHSDLLPRTDVVVTSGGAGTVLATLRAGVPVILAPTEWDKPDVAQRVAATGAGLLLPPSQRTPRGLRAAVKRVLGTPSFRASARRLARALERAPGPVGAARLLEQLHA